MKISVVGLGFVGFPLYLTILNSRVNNLSVIGVENDNQKGRRKIKKILDSNNKYFNNKELDKIFIKYKKIPNNRKLYYGPEF